MIRSALVGALPLALLFPTFAIADPGAQAPPKHISPEAELITGRMIIWSGSKNEEEAQALHQNLKESMAQLADYFVLTPQLIESKTVEGLKPGFFVTSLGVCNAEDLKPALRWLKALRPEAYTKEVRFYHESPESFECPKLGEVDADAEEPVHWTMERSAHLRHKRLSLRGIQLSFRWSQLGDFARDFHEAHAVFLLIGKKGRILDQVSYASPEDAAEARGFSAQKRTIGFDFQYAEPPCDPDTDRFELWKRRAQITAQGEKINVTEKPATRIKSGACGYASEAAQITGSARP